MLNMIDLLLLFNVRWAVLQPYSWSEYVYKAIHHAGKRWYMV